MKTKLILLILVVLMCSVAVLGACGTTEYTITFVDGNTVLSTRSVEKGEALSITSSITKTGYELEGIYIDADLSISIGDNYIISGDATLYTKWSLVVYTATFVDGDDIIGTADFTVENLSVVEPTLPTKQGFEASWASYTLSASDITIAVVWTEVATEYAVSFYSDNELYATAGFDLDYSSVTLPEEPTKEGYLFVGWFDADGVAFDGSVVPSDSIDVTAKWEKLYTLTYNYLGQSHSQYVQAGQAMPNYEATNSTLELVGWYMDELCTIPVSDTTVMPSQDTTIYSKWQLADFDIAVDNATITYGEDATLTAQFSGLEGVTYDYVWVVDGTTYGSTQCVVSGLTVGSYDVTIEIDATVTVDGVIYQNTSSTTATIAVDKATVTVSAVEGLIYNGTEQTGVVDSSLYTVTGGVATEAGTHTATVALVDTVNYMWADQSVEDMSVSFDISALDITDAQVGEFDSLTYTSVAQTPSAIVTIGELTVTGSWSDVTAVADTTTFTASGNFTGTIADQAVGMSKATVTVTVDDCTKAYGEANPTFTYTAVGLLGEDTLAGSAVFDTEATADSVVGSYDVTVSGLSNDNYDITLEGGTLTVASAVITLTADNFTITYGDELPTLTYTASGFLTGDESMDIGNVSLVCNYVAGSDIGTYDIIISTDANLSNYAFRYVDATLTVEAKAITLDVTADSITYGDDVPAYASTVTGLVGSDSLSVEYTCSYAVGSGVGSYDITATATDSNYVITVNNATLTVVAKSILVEAANKAVTYGQEVTFDENDYVITGLVEGESLVIHLDCDYVVGSNVGTYDITVSVENDANYVITTKDGTLTVGKAFISYPSAVSGLVYNGTEQAGVLEGTGYILTDNTATTAGKHTATAVLDSNYQWSNGTTADVEIDFTIAKATVTAPSADETQFVYTGAEQTYTLDEGSLYTIGDNTTQTNVGTYTITVTLTDITNYTWSDGSTEVKSYTFIIAKASNSISDLAITGWTYGEDANSATATAVFGDISYTYSTAENGTYSSTVPSTAGTYFVKASVAATEDYAGATATASFTIAKATYSMSGVSFDSDSFTYNGSAHTLVISGDLPDGVSVSYSTNSLTNVDSIEVIASFTGDSTNYELIDSMSATLAVTALSISGATVGDFDSLTYTGSSQTPVAVVTINGLEVTGSWSSVTNVGETSTFTADGNFTGSIEGESVGMAKAEVSAPTANSTKFTYTGSEQEYTLDTSELYSINGNKATTAGTHIVTLTLTNSDNYTWAEGAVTSFDFVIAKADTVITTTGVETSYTYNGDEQSVTTGATANHTESTVEYTNNKFTTVGDYTVTISIAESANYNSASVTVEVTVNKATIDMTGVEWNNESSYTYNGDTVTITLTNLPTGVSATYTGNSATDAGNYTAVATLIYDTVNYNTISVDNLDWSIARATVDAPVAVEDLVYNGTVQTGVVEGTGYTLSGNTATNAGTHTATATLGSNYTWADGTQDISISYTIAAKAVTVVSSASNVTFGDSAPTFASEITGVVNGDDLAVVLSSTYAVGSDIGSYTVAIAYTANSNYTVTTTEGTFTVSALSVTGAKIGEFASLTYSGTVQTPSATVTIGGYTVTGSWSEVAAVADTSTFTASGNFTGTIADQEVGMNKATLTVTAESFKVVFGAAVPSYAYTTAGIVDDVTLNVEYSCDYTSLSGVGSYAITVEVDDLDNYTVETVAGTVTVSSAELTITANSFTITYGEDLPEFTYTYTGVLVGDIVVTFTVTGYTEANGAVGTYSIVPSVDNSNYDIDYANGTLTVVKATIDMTGVEWNNESSYTYNGDTVTIELTGLPTGVSATYTGNSATDAGNYTAVATLIYDTVNYNTISVDNLDWSIARATVDAPVAVEGLVYNGTVQTGVVEGTGYTLSGNTATNAGTHTATATLGSNYTWADGTQDISISYTIAAKEASVVSSASNVTFGDSAPTFASDITGVVDGDDLAVVLSSTYAVGSDIGTYTVTIAYTANSNYTVTTTEGTFTVSALSVTGATIGDFDSLTYSGSVQTPSATVTIGGYTVTGSWSDVTAVADTSTFTASGNFTGTIADQEVGMSKATVTAPIADSSSFTYTGAELTYALTENSLYTIGGNSTTQTNAGTYTITVTLDDSDNYMWSDETTTAKSYTFTIDKATNSISGLAITGWTYGEDANSATAAAVFGDISYTYSTAENGTYSSAVPTTAGTYFVKASVEGTDNYDSATATASFVIAKATVTVPTADSTVFTYNGSQQTYTLAENSLYTIGGDSTTQTNVGTYTITVTLDDSANYMWSDDTTEVKSYTFTIAKASNSISDLAITGWTYGEDANSATATSVFGDISYTYSTAENGTYSSTVPTTAGTYFVMASVEGTDNYDSATATTSFVIAKATYSMSGVSFDSDTVTYNGTAHTLVISGELPTGVEVSYSTNSLTNVGSVEVVASFTGDSTNYNAIDDMTATLTVAKASVTVVVDDSTITYADAVPTYTSEVTGLVEGDSLTINYSCSYVVGNNAGTYTISATVDAHSNYDITVEAGTLTVSKATLTVTAGDVVATYGDTSVSYSYTVSGLLNDDKQSIVTGTATYKLDYDNGEVLVSDLDDLTNYTIEYVAGELTTSNRAITVTLTSVTATYGSAPEYAYAITSDSGLVAGDSLTVTYICVYSGVGDYDITATVEASCEFYDITVVDATLTVVARDITVTVDNISIAYGDAIPTYSYTCDGLVGDDSLTLNYTCSYAVGSNASTYGITATATADANYNITVEAGTLTVTKATVTAPTAVSGLVYTGSALAGVVGTDLYTVTGGTATTAGTHTATVTLTDSSNYMWADGSSEITVEFTIAKATVTAPSAVSGLVYNGSAQTGVLAGDGYTIANNTATGAGTYTATVTLTDGDNYMWSNGDSAMDIDFTIAKADYTGITTSAVSADYVVGMTLANFTLPTGFSWADSTIAITASTGSYAASYNADSANYNNFELNITANVVAVSYDVATIEFDFTDNSTTSYDISSLATITVGGETVTGATLSFASASSGTTVSTAGSLSLPEGGSTFLVTITASHFGLTGSVTVVVKAKSVLIGTSGSTYYTIEDALNGATSGKTVTVAFNACFADSTAAEAAGYTTDSYYTVKSGVVLLVPYSEDFSANLTDTTSANTYSSTSATGYVYLTVLDGITIYNSGVITVNAQRTHYQPVIGHAYETNYGTLELQGNSNIVSTGNINAIGFIIGTGSIDATSGTVTETMILLDYMGGSVTSSCYGTVFPINTYAFTNIVVELNIYTSASFVGSLVAYVSGWYDTTCTIIGNTTSAFLCQTGTGYITKTIDDDGSSTDTGRQTFTINNDASINDITLKLATVTTSTAGKDVPIGKNMTIVIASGYTADINVNVKIMAGGIIEIEEGATAYMSGDLYSYRGGESILADTTDAEGRSYTYADKGSTGSYTTYSTTGSTINDPGQFIVNGTLVLESGASIGAQFSGNGVIVVESGVTLSHSVTEANIDLDGGFLGLTAGPDYYTSPTYSAVILAADSSSTTISGSGTYYLGNYVLVELNGASLSKANSGMIVAETINLDNYIPTANGYTFAGWYTTADYQEGTEISGIYSGENGITIYAKMTLEMTFTKTYEDGTVVTETVTQVLGQEIVTPDGWTDEEGFNNFVSSTGSLFDYVGNMTVKNGYSNVEVVWIAEPNFSLTLMVDGTEASSSIYNALVLDADNTDETKDIYTIYDVTNSSGYYLVWFTVANDWTSTYYLSLSGDTITTTGETTLYGYYFQIVSSTADTIANDKVMLYNFNLSTLTDGMTASASCNASGTSTSDVSITNVTIGYSYLAQYSSLSVLIADDTCSGDIGTATGIYVGEDSYWKFLSGTTYFNCYANIEALYGTNLTFVLNGAVNTSYKEVDTYAEKQ